MRRAMNERAACVVHTQQATGGGHSAGSSRSSGGRHRSEAGARVEGSRTYRHAFGVNRAEVRVLKEVY